MSLDIMNYLRLSALAYLHFDDTVRGRSINYLINEKYIQQDKLDKLELSALKDSSDSLRSWLLLDTVTTSSGMSAIALQNPDTKEVVFAL